MSITRLRRLALAVALVAALGAAVGLLGACGSSDPSSSASPSSGSVTVTDDVGETITLDQPATRIVSLAPANTEIAYAVGAGDAMVAGTSYDDYPAAAKDLPKIGDFANPSLEKIASYDPDLVLAAAGLHDKLRTRLEELGAKVYVVDPKTYDGVMEDVAELGKLAGTTEKAGEVVAAMQKAKDEVRAKVGSLETATTFLEIYSKPLMTAGSDTFIDDMISIAGGENIGAAAGSGFPNFSSETLLEDDPAVYIADSGSMSKPGDIDARSGYSDLTAVKEGHVYVIEDDLIARPGPRLAQGLRKLAAMIHPEAYVEQ